MREPIPLAKCRQIVGDDLISDDDLIRLRDDLYALAGIVVGQFLGGAKERCTSGLIRGRINLLSSSSREDFEERAAIRQFDGRQELSESEVGALDDVLWEQATATSNVA